MGFFDRIGDFLGDIAPGLDLIGGLLGDSSAKDAARDAQLNNIEAAKNAHQWEVEDLRKAGLNPILSATGGSGARTASSPVAQVGNLGRGIQKAASSALEAKLMNAQAENLDSQTRKNNQDYSFDRYFKPLERMQALTAGRTGIDVQKANTANAVATLSNLQEDLQSKKISNDQARELLKEIKSNPQFRDFWLSVPYAERNALDKLFQGGAEPSDWIKAALLALRK